jgi:hypothetical protein
MKTLYKSLLCLTASLLLTSCMDKYTEELTMNVPVYMDYQTLRTSVRSTSSRNLVNPGKIYFKGNYLLVVEYREGIHVIDVSDPTNPQNKVFIEIPGCIDLAIKDNSLYTDSYVDLVTIDISDILNPKESYRIEDVFTYTIPVAENVNFPYSQVEQEKGVVIKWEPKREKHELEQRYYPVYPVYYDYYGYNKNLFAGAEAAGSSGSAATSFGKSGSMARFGLYDQYLYVVDNYSLRFFNVKNAASPFLSGSQGLSGNVETMFVYDDHLFFGTTTGMLVYSLRVPSLPEYISAFWHVTSCDPVVIQDGYAYITLRGGTTCNNSTVNRLDVVEFSNDYKQFSLVNSYDLTEPYGLGIDENVLFICDGKAGLKVYDVTDKKAITNHLIASFPAIQTYDVIPLDGYLFMVGKEGFYLYDYSDLKNIRQIGSIPVVKD